MAQSAAVASIQLAGELDDRRAFARPQLRAKVLPSRGAERGAAVWRTAPLRAGAGRGPWISCWRAAGEPSAAQVWTVEIRGSPFHQGISRPAHRQVPDRLRPAAATSARWNRPVLFRRGCARRAVSNWLLGRAGVVRPRSGAAQSAGIDLLDRRNPVRRPAHVDRIPGRADHGLYWSRCGNLFHRRMRESRDDEPANEPVPEHHDTHA